MNEKNDEIDLIELISILIKGWKIVLSTVFVFCLGAVVYLKWFVKPQYTSSVTFMLKGEKKIGGGVSSVLGALGGGLFSSGGTEIVQLEYSLKSTSFTMDFIKEYNLLPVLFEESWDSVAGDWTPEVKKAEMIPDYYDGAIGFPDRMSVKLDKQNNIVVLDMIMHTPELAKQILEDYVHFLDSSLVEKKQKAALSQIKHMEEQYRNSQGALLTSRFKNLIASQYEQLALFAESSIEILVDPLLPKKPMGSDKKKVLFLFAFAGFFIGCCLTFLGVFIRAIRIAVKQKK